MKKQLIQQMNFVGNNKGIALFEMLPLLVVFVALVGLTVGLWGAVHSGVLQSIAARHYAFEIINNRSHFEYHRDYNPGEPSPSPFMYNNSEFAIVEKDYYGDVGSRLFYITSSKIESEDEPYVPLRGINFFEEIKRAYNENPKGIIPFQEKTASAEFHRDSSDDDPPERVNPLWLMTGYGICIDCPCGEDGGDADCN